MWKLSCLLLLLITIGKCSTYDGANNSNTENSSNDNDRENRKSRAEAKSTEYEEDAVRPYEDDSTRDDSEEFRSGKLIGKWRNNGEAFEPKWRDGDSVPLVPFNTAKQTKVGRHDTIERSKYRDSSHAVTKPFARDASAERISKEGLVEDTNPVSENYPSVDDKKKDRYNYESRFRDEYDDTRSVSEFPLRSTKKTRTVLTDDLRYETAIDAKTSGKPSTDERKIESNSSRSRYRDTFQVNPNEYELNDEEYQKPRPRKRRPPQNHEFSEMRAPTYSITWSTERYIETTQSPDRPSWTKVLNPTRKRSEKPVRRNRNRTSGTETRKISENAELKSLLKMQQIEGLSLSELLQRRNLTLNDLLKGKADVINVLKASDSNEENVTEFTRAKPKITKKLLTTTASTKWRPSESRVKKIVSGNDVSPAPKSENDVQAEAPLKNNTYKKDEESMEHLESAESEDGQRNSNDNEKLSVIVRLTKPIILPRSGSFTVKSIVGTTESLAKESVDGYQNDGTVIKTEKPKVIDDDEIMEFSDFSVKKNLEAAMIITPELTTMRNINMKFDEINEDSGSTLSIENILGTTEQNNAVLSVTTLEPDALDNKMNNVGTEAINDTNILDLHAEYQSDEPQQNPDGIFEDELPMGDQPYEDRVNESADKSLREEEEGWTNHQIFSTSSKPYEVIVSEIEPDARAEISELFSSGSSAKRLELLLKSRNMSIDELIALRQRGSSKVHMAEVLRSREALASRYHNQYVNTEAIESEKLEDIETTNLSVTTIDDLSDVEIESISTEVPVSVTTEDHTNIASIGTSRTISVFTTEQVNVLPVEIEPTEPATTERNIAKNVQLLELLRAFDSLPFSVHPDSNQGNTEITKVPYETKDRRVPEDFVEKTKRLDLSTSIVEVGLVEEIANEEDSIPFDDSTDINLLENNSSTSGGEERRNLSKVRPSIIASGAILGVTIVVFLAIFIVCRIRQKQKYTYRNTFSRAVFQGPNMTARKLSNSSSLNTIMVNVVATSTTKRPDRHEQMAIDDEFDFKSDIENDSLDANDSWDTIPDFMK